MGFAPKGWPPGGRPHIRTRKLMPSGKPHIAWLRLPVLPLPEFRQLESYFDLFHESAGLTRTSKQWYVVRALLRIALNSPAFRGLLAGALYGHGVSLSELGVRERDAVLQAMRESV